MKKDQVDLRLPGGGSIISTTPSFLCEEQGCKNKIAWGVGWATGWECENIFLCQDHLEEGIEILGGLKRET